MSTLSFYLITGLSGAGKSHALQAFEDMGFYCVDNLPSELIEPFVSLREEKRPTLDELAIVLDIREGDIVGDFPGILEALRGRDIDLEVLFLEASSDALLNRYKESRRPHPLGKELDLREAIEYERRLLAPLREEADMVIDTTEITVHQLRGWLIDLHQAKSQQQITLSLISFGFKYGVPGHVDALFDARFLSNPHYEPSLRDLTGLDAEVEEYMEQADLASEYLDRIHGLLEMMLEAYPLQGKTIVTVGIGCTGGQHRSVYLVERLAERFEDSGAVRAIVTHRDIQSRPQR